MAGEKLSDNNHFIDLIDGLGDEYDSFVQNILQE